VRTVRCGGDDIHYVVQTPEGRTSVAGMIFCFHGMGHSNRSQSHHLAGTVMRAGHAYISMDFSGQGESGGTLAGSSIGKRVDEALAVIADARSDDTPLALLGTSMGCHVALEVVAAVGAHRIENLLFFAPALYAHETRDVRFGDGFKDMIRRENSYRQATAQKILSDFAGNLLVVHGRRDSLVSTEVIGMLDGAARHCRRKTVLRLDDCPHEIHEFLIEHGDVAATVYAEVAAMLTPARVSGGTSQGTAA